MQQPRGIVASTPVAVMTRAGHLVRRSTRGIERRTIDKVAERRASIDLAKTLERVGVPSAIADERGTITWLNAAARAAFGDLEGRPFISVVAPQHVAILEREQQRLLDGAPVADYEVEVLTIDGRRRAQISSVPIEGGDACHAVFGVAVTRPPRPATSSAQLTPRESEVLSLLSQGASTDDMAAALHLSKETVRTTCGTSSARSAPTRGSRRSRSHTASDCSRRGIDLRTRPAIPPPPV